MRCANIAITKEPCVLEFGHTGTHQNELGKVWHAEPAEAVTEWQTPPARIATGSDGKVNWENGVVFRDPETGAEKLKKDIRYDLLPVDPIAQISRVYDYGERKYAAHNWRGGYPWSLSYAAMQRHLNRFWGGEDIDPETKLPHLAHAGFHLFALLEFMNTNKAKDDRYAAKR